MFIKGFDKRFGRMAIDGAVDTTQFGFGFSFEFEYIKDLIIYLPFMWLRISWWWEDDNFEIE